MELLKAVRKALKAVTEAKIAAEGNNDYFGTLLEMKEQLEQMEIDIEIDLGIEEDN